MNSSVKHSAPTEPLLPFPTKRAALVIVFFAGALLLYFPTLGALVKLAFDDDAFTHILLIPIISGYFLFEKRKSIGVNARYSIIGGSALLLTAGGVWILQAIPGLSPLYGSLTIKTVSAVTAFIGGGVLLFGAQILKNALFPVVFLFLTVPFPLSLLDGIVSFYQRGTAAVADGIFALSGITYFRDGLAFHLPNLSINIAPQCSGIRSSTALIITGIIAAHLFLRTLPGKAVFILVTIPLVLVKNGIRVATLSLLGAYVNMSFINGDLHKKGGFVFFLFALVLLFGGMFAIKKAEELSKPKTSTQPPKSDNAHQ
jgi:exosortase